MSHRFAPEAAKRLRLAVREAGGVEVFAIGDVEGGVVTGVTITCRGQGDRVLALLDRPRSGQVVVHNHPSGVLTPSDADMELAGRYGDDGVGFVIVDSAVSRSNWVVEPHAKRPVGVDPAAVERFFRETLPAAVPGYAVREGQLAMALEVAAAMSDDRPYVCEAGTGTGKSLAYLVPAALWALANDGKVVVSTFTRTLQGQLWLSDLPLLAKGGIDVRAAVLQGRSNYVCKRRLGVAVEEDRHLPPEERVGLDALVAWEATSADGARTDVPFPLEPQLWERIESDSDLTLRVKCPHYATCRYYGARRDAAGAHIVVVNHALLLADLAIRGQNGPGVLPKYHRIVLDEAHHVEDAATSATGSRVGMMALQRALAPLRAGGRRSAIDRLAELEGSQRPLLPPSRVDDFGPLASAVSSKATALRSTAAELLRSIASDWLEATGHPRRITDVDEESPQWRDLVEPQLQGLACSLDEATNALESLLSLYDDVPMSDDRGQPVLDLRRAHRRIAGYAATTRAMLQHDATICRWIEARHARSGDVYAELVHGPIEVGGVLRRILWEKLPGTAATSATMTVGGQFTHWMRRAGLDEARTGAFPSPFAYAEQAILALPRDVPVPDDPDFLRATSEILVDAVRASEGGAFVLCTSYAAVRAYADVLRAALPDAWPVLRQEGANRTGLVGRFRENPRSVLVGTDSFWEGVDVRGDALRLVVIPRLPFRVPTDPLHQARHEHIAARGGDPFRHYSLPEAVLKLKQGFGRLIRSRADRGVVLLLDRRLHDRTYGRIMLASLPPARRVVGPWAVVREHVARFYER